MLTPAVWIARFRIMGPSLRGSCDWRWVAAHEQQQYESVRIIHA